MQTEIGSRFCIVNNLALGYRKADAQASRKIIFRVMLAA